MDIDLLNKEIKEYNKTTHGSSDHHKDSFFVRGEGTKEFAPLGFLKKKLENLGGTQALVKEGFVFTSLDFFGHEDFILWFESQYGRKLTVRQQKPVEILERPNNKEVFDVIGQINKCYSVLREQKIILNGKNLPVQLGEWYARSIFGLKQTKSTSQRGFDFFIGDKRVEVKVHWSDQSSMKGVKIRKSLIELSQYCVLIYLNTNFMIRELCFLDSEYVMRKFANKGHTLFLKDTDLAPYFFSKSDKHRDKIANPNALLKFATPTLAMNLAEYFQ